MSDEADPIAAAHYTMSSWVPQTDAYVTLTWPRNCELWQLKFIRELVNFQLDTFILPAQKEEDGKTEYESWFPKEEYLL